MSDLIHRHLTQLRAAGRVKTTIYERGRVLVRVDAALPWGIEDADSDEVSDWFSGAHAEHWSVATRSVYWNHLDRFYQWGVDYGLLTINPMAMLTRPPHPQHMPDPVTDEELHLALTLSPEQPWRMAVMLAAYAGLRCCEIVAVNREDVTERATTVRRGKGGKPRTVETAPLLWEYVRGRARGPLVVGARGRRITAGTLSQEQHAMWLRLGLGEVHMHRFRHWFATRLLAAGVDIRTVQELMGHTCLSSTQVYTQVVSAQRVAAIRLLPAVGHEPVSTRLVPPSAEAA